MYQQLFSPVMIGKKTIKNRVCFPPVGLAIDGDENGILDIRKHNLYLKIAQAARG